MITIVDVSFFSFLTLLAYIQLNLVILVLLVSKFFQMKFDVTCHYQVNELSHLNVVYLICIVVNELLY